MAQSSPSSSAIPPPNGVIALDSRLQHSPSSSSLEGLEGDYVYRPRSRSNSEAHDGSFAFDYVPYHELRSELISKQDLARSLFSQWQNIRNETSTMKTFPGDALEVTSMCCRDLWRWIEENALNGLEENDHDNIG